LILKYVVDGKFFYVFQVGERSFAKYGFETREAAELAMIVDQAKAAREYVFAVVRQAADQTEIVFPKLSAQLKEAFKVMTKRYPKPLIADLLDNRYSTRPEPQPQDEVSA
jgi:hypothetical protein